MTPIVCLIQNKTPINPAAFQFLLQFSPPGKQQRILRQRIKQNADSMVIGGALARYMLWKEFRVPVDAQIGYGEFGKPYLLDYPRLHFNISHSGQFVVCAVCNEPVGIDVQQIITYRTEVAERVCNNTELAQIRTCSVPDEEFTKIWVEKEAYLKMFGLGLGNGVNNIGVPSYLSSWTIKYQNTFISIVYKYQNKSGKITDSIKRCS